MIADCKVTPIVLPLWHVGNEFVFGYIVYLYKLFLDIFTLKVILICKGDLAIKLSFQLRWIVNHFQKVQKVGLCSQISLSFFHFNVFRKLLNGRWLYFNYLLQPPKDINNCSEDFSKYKQIVCMLNWCIRNKNVAMFAIHSSGCV